MANCMLKSENQPAPGQRRPTHAGPTCQQHPAPPTSPMWRSTHSNHLATRLLVGQALTTPISTPWLTGDQAWPMVQALGIQTLDLMRKRGL